MPFITTNLSEPGDEERGISRIHVALRWDGRPLSKQHLYSRAAQAVKNVDRKYDKDLWDVQILVIDEERQYVQLSVRADYSSANEAEQILQDLKRAFKGVSEPEITDLVINKGHKTGISCVAFSPNNNLITSCSIDGSVHQWSLPEGKLVRTIRQKSYWDNFDLDRHDCLMTLSSNASFMAHVDRYWTNCGKPGKPMQTHNCINVEVIESGQPKSMEAIQPPIVSRSEYPNNFTVGALALSPDASFIVHSHYREVLLSYLKPHKNVAADSYTNQIYKSGPFLTKCISIASERKIIALGGQPHILILDLTSTEQSSFDIDTLMFEGLVRNLPIPIDSSRNWEQLQSIALSPTAAYIAAGSFSGRILLWDLRDNSVFKNYSGGGLLWWDYNESKGFKNFKGHQPSTMCVAISPDGNLLASAGMDKAVHLWNIPEGEKISTVCVLGYPGHGSLPQSMAFSHNGRMLAIGDTQGSIHIRKVLGKR